MNWNAFKTLQTHAVAIERRSIIAHTNPARGFECVRKEQNLASNIRQRNQADGFERVQDLSSAARRVGFHEYNTTLVQPG